MTNETNYDGVTVISHGMPDIELLRMAAMQLLKTTKGGKNDEKAA